jgi:hypothetical protein
MWPNPFGSKKYATSLVVLTYEEDGVQKDRREPGIMATLGAVEWRRAGGLLKHLVEGRCEFDIRFE